MEMTGSLVMAADTVLLSVDQLSSETRRQIQASEGDYAITRPNSRTTTRVVDSDAAKLLEEFRRPTTVVEAVIRYCSGTKEDPESTLEAAFPMLEKLLHARLLLPADSPQAQSVRPLLDTGCRFAGAEVLACLQSLEDTDVYRVKTFGGEHAALKVLRSEADPEVARMFDREAFVLAHLNAIVSPALLSSRIENGTRYLMLSWCEGSDCVSAAAALRSAGDQTGLLRLALSVLDAYVQLHAQQVVHSDVHPRNILVDENGSVRIIDFGLARISGVENEFRRSERGGLGYFFEPEYANALRSGQYSPLSSMLGEQYAIGALIYFLLTSKHYVNFYFERNEMLRQIEEDAPLPFESRGLQPWPALEEILGKALAKDPAGRFPTTAAFAAALRSVSVPAPPDASSDASTTSYASARENLTRLLKRLDVSAPLLQSGIALAPKASINYGSGGVACALHTISCARQDATILALADLWGERAARDARLNDAWYCADIEITPDTVGRVSPYHTESGVYFIRALIAHSRGDLVAQQDAVLGFIAAVNQAPEDSLDLTLGRSGILLAAARLIATLRPDSVLHTAISELGSTTIASIWQQLDSYSPITECPEIPYSGIAHGWAGMLYATLCWCRASGAEAPSNASERLNQLAALARHSGRQARWCWSTVREPGQVPGPFMAGWCNGSAGQVYVWLAAYCAMKESQYLVLAEKAAWHAVEAEAGIGNLCCGLSGQAYALLALYRQTRERSWLHRAQVLAEKSAITFRDMPTGGEFDVLALRPNSLYKGELGVAVLAADLENPDGSAFPAFEFIDF